MTKPEELELFSFLARQHKLREWLNDKLAGNVKVLVQASDIEQLRKSQGQASLIEQMLRLMDEAPEALQRNK